MEQETDHHHSRHSAPLPHHSRHSAPPPTPPQQAQCTPTPSQQAQCTSTPSQQAQCTSYPITTGTVHLYPITTGTVHPYPITAGTVHLLPHHSRHKGHSHNQTGTNIPPVIGTNVTHFIITVGTNVTPNTTSTNVTCSIIKTGTIVTPTDVSLCKTICRDYVPSKHKSHTSIIPIDTATTKIPTQLQLPSLELSLWPHLLISKRNRSATANLLSSAEFPSSASTSSGVGTYFRSYRGWGVTIVTYAMKDRKFKLGHSNNRDLSTTTLEECIITKAKQHLTTRDISACAE